MTFDVRNRSAGRGAGGVHRGAGESSVAELTETPAWQGLVRHFEQVKDLHMRRLFEQDGKRFEKHTLSFEDILFDSTVGNGVITDSLRTAGANRDYTSAVTMISSGDVFSYSIVDFNTFFTSDENVISQGLNDGFQVIFTGTAGGLNNIEHGTLTVAFIVEPP